MTDLSETIARLEDGIALEANHPGSVRISPERARVLRDAARRVQAMDEAPGIVRDIRAHIKQYGRENAAVVFSRDLSLILDLASDRDAQAAEVERLRGEVEQERVRLAGCSVAALGGADDVKLGDYGHSASLDDARITYRRMVQAESQVRELETELSRAVRSLHEHGHKQAASTFYRFLPSIEPEVTP